MSSSDPQQVVDALERAADAFEHVGHGRPQFEADIDPDGDWKTQLTKACRLREVAGVLRVEDGYYTAVIEVCFGAIERSIEAYAIAMAGDELRDFQDHEFSYERASDVGLFDQETTAAMQELYTENRTESYYGGGRPTARQAAAMDGLAAAVHTFIVDQIREGGVCVCDE